MVLPATLVVYEVKGNRAKAYYGWNNYKPWGVSAGCRMVAGVIKKGVLTFSDPDRMEYKTSGNGLSATYYFAMGTKNQFIEKGNFARKQ